MVTGLLSCRLLPCLPQQQPTTPHAPHIPCHPTPHRPQIVAYLTHWVACGFEWYARSVQFDPRILVGTNPALFTSVVGGDRYLYSVSAGVCWGLLGLGFWEEGLWGSRAGRTWRQTVVGFAKS